MKVSLKKCEKLLCNNIHFYLSTPDKYKFKEVHKSAINQTLRIRLFFRDFCGFQATSQKNLKGFLRPLFYVGLLLTSGGLLTKSGSVLCPISLCFLSVMKHLCP